MRLRLRVMLAVGLTTVALVAGHLALSKGILLHDYGALEARAMDRDVERATYAVEQLGQDLHMKSVDWAEWDDTYRFVRDRNAAYVRANLVESSLATMQMDLVLYADPEWRIIEAVRVHRTVGVVPPDARTVVAALRSARRPAARLTDRAGVFGWTRGPAGPLLVSARPILTTLGKGPARGWLVFGRYLDTAQVRQLAERTCLDVRFHDLLRGRVSEAERAVVRVLTARPLPFARPQDEHTIVGSALVRDLADRPFLLLQVQAARSIYQQGLETSRYLVGLVVVAALVFGGVVVLVLERFVLSRTVALSRQVERIGTDGGWVERVGLPGGDELSLLADRINAMLDALARTHEIEQNEARLRVHNEALEELVAERTRQIEHQSLHDPLTDLPNRALFLDRLNLALRRARRSGTGVAVLFLDLDNFKTINDSKGHDAGDRLLMDVAGRLHRCLRPGDTVARFGGDEFTVVLEDLRGEAEAVGAAERIAQALEGPVRLPQSELFVAASIGIAYCAGAEADAEALLRNADTAMYQAKADGKGGCVLFDQSMNDRVVERLEIESGLRRALDRGELVVYYQPLMDLATGTLSGVEALVRWQHPSRGLILPSQFIPTAEETGLIVPLGYWVLERACLDMAAWSQGRSDGTGFTVSVNLSGRQLHRPDVVQRIDEILRRTGLDPALLKIEITESVLVADGEGASSKLRQLRALGIKLVIDDFGTGYSSISSLQALPVDTVKIDRAFINRLRDEEGANVVAAIMALSRTMRLDVTAEGIETDGQLEWLKRLGCATGQGFLLARPMPGDALEAHIQEGRRAVARAEHAVGSPAGRAAGAVPVLVSGLQAA